MRMRRTYRRSRRTVGTLYRKRRTNKRRYKIGGSRM